MENQFSVGQSVEVRQRSVYGDKFHGYGTVLAVTSRTVKVNVSATQTAGSTFQPGDLRVYRTDGYLYGSKPDRGIGRSFAERIILCKVQFPTEAEIEAAGK